MNSNLATTQELSRSFEPSPGWKEHFYWVFVLGLLVVAWSVSPLAGPYVAALCNAVVGIALIAMSARSPQGGGSGLVYLGLLPLARMMGIVFSAPLELFGFGPSGSDLWLSVGVLAVALSTRTVEQWRIKWKLPRWETVLILVSSSVLAYLFGSKLGSLPSMSIPIDLTVVIGGFAVEWIFRGPMFAVMSKSIGPVWTIIFTTLVWLAVGHDSTYLSMAYVLVVNVLYGVAKWRGERTFWIGISHALLNVLILLPAHPLGGG